jgi:hypothetical protein
MLRYDRAHLQITFVGSQSYRSTPCVAKAPRGDFAGPRAGFWGPESQGGPRTGHARVLLVDALRLHLVLRRLQFKTTGTVHCGTRWIVACRILRESIANDSLRYSAISRRIKRRSLPCNNGAVVTHSGCLYVGCYLYVGRVALPLPLPSRAKHPPPPLNRGTLWITGLSNLTPPWTGRSGRKASPRARASTMRLDLSGPLARTRLAFSSQAL